MNEQFTEEEVKRLKELCEYNTLKAREKRRKKSASDSRRAAFIALGITGALALAIFLCYI